jgi:adenylate cyclase
MTSAREQQRVAAVLMARVDRYVHLIAADESSVRERLRHLRSEVMSPRIAAHGGHVVATSGESFMAEFGDSAEALRCAVKVQRELNRRQTQLADDERIALHIGIDFGSVTGDETDIAGDAVSTAGELARLSKPGGICVSHSMQEHVAATGDLDLTFEDAGVERNAALDRPLHTFHVNDPANAVAQGQPPRKVSFLRRWRDRLRRHRTRALAVAAVVLGVGGAAGHFIGGIAGVWEFYRVSVHGAKPAQPEVKPITMSLAIGNFAAPADDAAAARLARTVVRDLATALGAVQHSVRVISTASSSEVRSAIDMREVARRAGARYVVDGDVRSGAEKASINLRLVDTEQGTQVWSSRFDLGNADSSLGTTAAGRKVVGELADAVDNAETNRVLRKPTNQLDAMELVLRGYAAWGPASSLAHAREVRRLADAAVHLDPNLAAAMQLEVAAVDYLNDMDPQPDHDRYVRETDEFSARAVALDPGDSRYWFSRALALMLLGNWNASLEASERSIKLDPYSAKRYSQRAWLMTMMARPADAVALTDQALTLFEANPGWTLRVACEAHLLLGEPEKAIEKCERAAGFMAPDWSPYFFLPAAYANAGEMDHASTALKTMLQAVPGYTIAQLRAKRYSDHPEYQRLAEKYWYAGLRKAGLPEK